VNRDITGIPKKEYWIQMQLQMETADLNECDFLETQFAEEGEEESGSLMTGTIIYFMKDGKPHYEYEPIGFNRGESEVWFYDAMERNQAHMWMKTIRWRLEKMSCVLVLRNKQWFQHAIRVLDDLWQTIVKERNNPQGCEHRAPKRRPTNAVSANLMQAWLQTANAETSHERKCLIDLSTLEMN
jgi:hypothetical protein